MGNILSLARVRSFLRESTGGVIHGQQVASLANAVYGAMHARRLSISAIGRSYARLTGNYPKHGVKQVDRLVGNLSMDLDEVLHERVRMLVGPRKRIIVSLDWTEYDETDQSRIAVNLVTRHGRATPLVWATVIKSQMRGRRTAQEKKVLRLLKECVPEGVQVTLLADRGFCSTELFSFIEKRLGWEYVIRIRGNLMVSTARHNSCARLVAWLRVIRGAPARLIPQPLLTARKYRVPSLAVVWDRQMKEPWYVVSNRTTTAEAIVKLYARRFTCEEQFRDEKDDRLGAGSKETLVSTTRRRDMLTLIHALATVLLTVLGCAGERLGYDRKLRANTVRKRTHSLYRQGKEYLDGVHSRFTALFRRMFEIVLREHGQLVDIYGVL
jgi:hypothetical protein